MRHSSLKDPHSANGHAEIVQCSDELFRICVLVRFSLKLFHSAVQSNSEFSILSSELSFPFLSLLPFPCMHSLQPMRISMEEAVAKAERYRVDNLLLFPPVHKGE